MAQVISFTRILKTYFFLSSQTYRHVDNIMFENADILDNFLSFWRTTTRQRIGFMVKKNLSSKSDKVKSRPSQLKVTLKLLKSH